MWIKLKWNFKSKEYNIKSKFILIEEESNNMYPRLDILPASLLFDPSKVESGVNKVDAEDEGGSDMDNGSCY